MRDYEFHILRCTGEPKQNVCDIPKKKKIKEEKKRILYTKTRE